MTFETFSLTALGCRVNQTEADAYREIFGEAGIREVPFGQPADIVIVHTCTVTATADAKSRQLIHKGVRSNPGAVVVVSGCYAQISDQAVAGIPGVDLVIGTRDRGRILELAREAAQGRGTLDTVTDILRERTFEELPVIRTGRTRAFMKIEEGCSQFCSYCIIPYARGPVRSRLPENVFRETELLLEEGFRELVLTGIHTGAYGQDLEGWTLARLVRELTRYEKLERIRLSSLDPNEFTEELLEVLYEGPPVMNHLHISLQSGDDTVLSRMRRQYDSSRFLTLTEDLYRNIPGLALTADVMVGFPGETDRQHRNSMEVIRKTGFADIHVFSYSPRQGTRAAAWPDQVQEEVREQRRQEMLRLKKKLRSRFLEAQVGKPARVLVETVRRGHASGHTENFLQAKIYGENYIKNRMVDGIIVDVREDCLILETEACHE